VAGERSLLIRLSVKDADVAVQALERFGSRGRTAVQSIENATRPASRGLLTLSAAVGQVRGRIDGFASRAGALAPVLSALGPAGLAAAAGIGGAVVAFRQFNQAVTQADQLGKFADRIGVSTSALQELRFAAERSGVAANNLDTGIQRFTRRMAEAVQGTGELKGTLEQYGISLRNADGSTRDNLDVLADLADVMASTTDEAERLRIAVKAFDQEGAGLVNLFGKGAEAVQDLRDRAAELGLVLDEQVVRDAERARDALDTFGRVVEMNVNRVLLRLAPIAAEASEALADFFAKVRFIGSEHSELGQAIARYFGEATETAGRSREELLAELERVEADLEAFDKSAEGAAARAGDAVAGAIRARMTSTARALAEEIKALGEAARQAAEAAFDWDLALAGDTGAAGFDRARAALAELRGELDQAAKIEAERAEKIAEATRLLDTMQASEELRVETLAEINRHYDEKIEKLEASTKATKKATEADEAAAEAVERLADQKRTLRERLVRLEDATDRTSAATRAYNETLLDLDLALELGVLSQDQHAEKVRQAERVYSDAISTVRAYELSVANASRTAANVRVPQFDAAGLLRSGVDLIASGTGGVGGGFGDLGRGLLNLGISQGSNFLLDGLFSGNPLGSLLSSGASNLVSSITGLGNTLTSSLAQIAPSLGNALGSFFGVQAGLGPAGLLTGGLGPGGAGGAVASQVASGALAQAGFAAAAGPIAIAVAGLALLATQIFGPGKTSGPALGATFNVDDDRLGVRAVGADNNAAVEDAQKLADGVSDFVNQFLESLGATLRPGAFGGEVGYESGEYASAISSPGLTEGDRRSGRSPDLRRFATAEEAVGDFVYRSILDALERGLVDGISTATEGVLRAVLGRLERDGGADAEAVGEALDFAVAFEDATARMSRAGDAAALQLYELGRSAEDAGAAQEKTVEDFVANLERYFGAVDREGEAARIDTSSARIQYDSRDGGESGFTIDGQTFRRRVVGDEGLQTIEFFNAATGAVVSGVRDAAEAIERYADQVQASANRPVVRDFGDPALMSEGMDAISRYVDELLGLASVDSTPLEGYELKLESGLASIDNLRGAVEALGLEADQVDDKLDKARDTFRETMRTGFNEDLAGQIRSLLSPASQVVEALVTNYESLRDQAVAVGGDLGLVDTLFEIQVAAAARQEEAARINEAIAARDDEIAALEGSTRSLDQLVASIRQTRQGLRIDRSLSPLSPTASLDEALRLFSEASAAGLGGDEEAAGRARDLARTVLELGRDVYASGPQYQSLYNQVDAGLAGLEDAFADDLAIARASLDELRGIREDLATALEAVAPRSSSAVSAASSVAGLRRLGDGQYTNAAGFDLGRDPAVNAAINERLISLGLEPISGFGEGQAAARRQADPIVDAVIRSITGYAEGGDHTGGLRIVGERGPELEATGRSRVYNASQTASILREAAAGGAGVAELLAELVAGQRAATSATRDLLGFLRGLVVGRQGSGFAFRAVTP